MIQVFKVLRGFYKIDYKLFFELVRGKTRGHELKLVKNWSNGNLRKYYFIQRIVIAGIAFRRRWYRRIQLIASKTVWIDLIDILMKTVSVI